MAATETENARLQDQLQQVEEDQNACKSMVALLAGGDANAMDAEEIRQRFLQMSSMFTRLQAKAPPAGDTRGQAAAPPAFAAAHAAGTPSVGATATVSESCSESVPKPFVWFPLNPTPERL